MQNEYLRTSVEKNVGIITLDHRERPHNTLSSGALDAIEAALEAFAAETTIHAIVIESGKADSFIVGADVNELRRFTDPGQPLQLSRRGHEMIRKVRSMTKPVVCAIHGPALGGGLELALACTYRVASHEGATRLGLPEVRLGLVPGGGGTQLLPRLVGIQQALGMMLTGKNVYPRSARRMGLVDALTHRPGLHLAAVEAARRLASGQLKRSGDRRSTAERALEATALTRRIIYQKARERVMDETHGNHPAPLHIIEVVKRGMEDGIDAGFEAEAQSFSALVFSDVAQELIFLFFAQREAQQNPWKEQARDVSSIGVLGGGLMGGGIAALSAQNGLSVSLKDLTLELAASARRITYDLARRKERKRAISSFERDAIVERVRPVTDYADLRYVDLVIEAVPEDLALKQDVIRETERVVWDDVVIASNTSSIPIGRIAAGMARPERLVGMHYFSPVPQIPLMEIIRTDRNTDEVVATAFDVGLKQGKTVIVVNDGPGFYTTRILAAYMNEALLLLEEGGRIDAIDEAMELFGFPMGPFKLFDLVGIDVAAKIDSVLREFFAKRGITSSDGSKRLADAGIKGQKTGEGFYLYDGAAAAGKARAKGINKNAYLFFGGSERKSLARHEVQDRLALTMVNEAAFCLGDGILNRPADGDVGAVFGLGFPPHLGGPFRYIDRRGSDHVLNRLEELRAEHGSRFEPAPVLREMAEQRRRFYD